MTALWTGPDRVTHRVEVETLTPKSAHISYFDNRRRGTMFRAGRRISHATRVRLVVWRHELREVQP